MSVSYVLYCSRLHSGLRLINSFIWTEPYRDKTVIIFWQNWLKQKAKYYSLRSINSLNLQDVRLKGIQNKIIIYQKALIIHIYELRHCKGKLQEYITFSVNFSVGSLNGTTNIQTIFDLVTRCLKHVWCYHSHSVPYVGFQLLKVVDLNLVDNTIHITT
jgi:hypothetical protein